MWTATGPTERAQELLKQEQEGGPLSRGEKAMPRRSTLSTGGNLKAVGELLIALGEGSAAVDGWLEEYGPRDDFPT